MPAEASTTPHRRARKLFPGISPDRLDPHWPAAPLAAGAVPRAQARSANWYTCAHIPLKGARMSTPPRWDMSNVYPSLESKEFQAAVKDYKAQVASLGRFFDTKLSKAGPQDARHQAGRADRRGHRSHQPDPDSFWHDRALHLCVRHHQFARQGGQTGHVRVRAGQPADEQAHGPPAQLAGQARPEARPGRQEEQVRRGARFHAEGGCRTKPVPDERERKGWPRK